MNPFSPKLVADYTEMVNQYLDTIDICNVNEFEKIECALSILLERNVVEIDVENESLKHRIRSLKELIDHPDWYVECPEQFDQYITIIKTRIRAKIIELNGLAEEQKQNYIERQNNLRVVTQNNAEKMAHARPPEPGSEAHTLSEEAWLLELQATFNQDGFNDHLLNNPLFSFLLTIRLLTNNEFFHANYQQLVQLTPTARSQILNYPTTFVHLIQHLSVNEINNLEDVVRLRIFENELVVTFLLSIGVSIEEIVSLETNVLTYLLQNLAPLSFLMGGEGGMPFNVFMGLSPELQSLFLQKPLETRILAQKGGSFPDLISLKAELLLIILGNFITVSGFIDAGAAFDEIIRVPSPLNESILAATSAMKILCIIDQTKISFGGFIKFTEKLESSFWNESHFENIQTLIYCGVTMDQLQGLEKEDLIWLLDNFKLNNLSILFNLIKQGSSLEGTVHLMKSINKA